MNGFGLNFYGYFVFSGIWICVYALWVRYINFRERSREERRHS